MKCATPSTYISSAADIPVTNVHKHFSGFKAVDELCEDPIVLRLCFLSVVTNWKLFPAGSTTACNPLQRVARAKYNIMHVYNLCISSESGMQLMILIPSVMHALLRIAKLTSLPRSHPGTEAITKLT